MAWTTPPVFSPGLLTASQLNILSNNLLETAPAKATAATWPRHFVSTGANAIAERLIREEQLNDTGTTTSTDWADLDGSATGPQFTIPTGAFALVFINCSLENNTDGQISRASFGLYGTTFSDPTDGRSVANQSDANREIRAGITQLMPLTAGDNNFAMAYRVSAGTGSFTDRRMTVMAL